MAALTSLGCPGCSEGPLRLTAAAATCRSCDREYPIVGGVPILVPDPAAWLAAHRDSVLAALAEHGRADADSVARVVELAPRPVQRETVADDWTGEEGDGGRMTIPPGGLGDELVAARGVLDAWIEARLPHRARVALELGPGAGRRTASLGGRAEALLVLDRSLRAVLRALDAGGATATGFVAELDTIVLSPGVFDLVVAENVIDLVADPAGLLASVRDALAARGRLVLTTPDPGLGLASGDADVLRGLAAEIGLNVVDEAERLPWLRVHDARHVEVYFVHALVAEPDA